MADINIKSRVKAKIEGKFYDLRPSENPQQKLPAKVVKYLEENDLLADAVVVQSSSTNSGEVARMAAEIERLTNALASAESERETAKTAQAEADQKLSEALAEIEKLNKK